VGAESLTQHASERGGVILAVSAKKKNKLKITSGNWKKKKSFLVKGRSSNVSTGSVPGIKGENQPGLGRKRGFKTILRKEKRRETGDTPKAKRNE